MKKRLMAALMICSMLWTIPSYAYAGDNETPLTTEQKLMDDEYRESIKEQYDVEKLSAQYHVDPEKLTDKIIEGETSGKFSPFSELEIIGKVKTKEQPINNAVTAEHIVYNQDSTAYLATGNPGASGLMPWVGSCAVHKVSGTTNTPLIPFGTTVSYLNRTVNIGGNGYSAFVVNDTGDPNNIRSLYWSDLYFGANTSANKTAALNYGVKSDITLYWIR